MPLDGLRRHKDLADAEIGKGRFVNIGTVVQHHTDFVYNLVMSFFLDRGTDQSSFVAVDVMFA